MGISAGKLTITMATAITGKAFQTVSAAKSCHPLGEIESDYVSNFQLDKSSDHSEDVRDHGLLGERGVKAPEVSNMVFLRAVSFATL